jgi:hypothetical protein
MKVILSNVSSFSVTWWRLFFPMFRVSAWPDEGYSFHCFEFQRDLMKVILSNLSSFSVTWWRLFFPIFRVSAWPDKGYTRNMSCTLNVISTFLFARKLPCILVRCSNNDKRENGELLFLSYFRIQTHLKQTFSSNHSFMYQSEWWKLYSVTDGNWMLQIICKRIMLSKST